MVRMYLCLVVILITATPTLAYEDEELICPPGHAVASVRRNSASENGPITGSCRPLASGIAKLKESKCERRGVLQCTNDFEIRACGDNEWLGGILSYQLSTTRANLMVPICCSSENVNLKNDSCRTVRLNGFLEPVTRRVPPGQVINRLKCLYLADQTKNVLDVTMHIKICPFHVNDSISLPHPVPHSWPSQQQTTKASVDAADEKSKESDHQSSSKEKATSEESKNACPPCLCECPRPVCPKGKLARRLTSAEAPSRDDAGSSSRECKCVCFCEYKCDSIS